MSDSYLHDQVVPDTGSEKTKKQQVADMFDSIAPRYDFMNRFLSAGIDVRWRKKALQLLQPLQPKRILDVATGTADVAIMAARLLHPEKITGIDISEQMLAGGRMKVADKALGNMIELQNGDSETINFPDATFDAVTVAFGVRNFENLEKGLREIHRVLKPGGRLVVLEFSKPKLPGVQQAYNLYMRLVAPGLAGALSKNRKAYQYLNDSIQAFPEGKDFVAVLQKTGFQQTTCKALTFGICSIYTGDK
ncbi:MAG TPA: bifunctional demethylmenaquinone methyltransferase/2-methoxy-6-polyprenyl-1,4-benzoquinol methylase UbiE [Lacibacter sp.]|nr:bifunctional demethylmenaquinone methyltransferase/2-methoxy-6-polyprenyl-1,4-benzoquinol methylase UbiE [Lacibacter sp.]HMO87930.1 bifunctional demethylmenaquinone methyltransferase/2-methoxy-6-polyprenyl-1,4-benzoquinol methylase UbiE [Lacibacter sp.]